MKNSVYINILFIILGYLSQGCGEESKGKNQNLTSQSIEHKKVSTGNSCESFHLKNKKNNLNINILLDLSSRIDYPGQQSKDIEYLKILANQFNTHVKSKKIGLLHDKMEVFFDPTPTNSNINELANKLKVKFEKSVSKNEWIPKIENLYSTVPGEIYELARNDSGTDGYPGSDTWRFFKDKVKDYCMDDCYRNILVVFTDGYMYYNKTLMNEGNRTSFITPKSLANLSLKSSDWSTKMKDKDLGFIPATNELSGLEVLVIGLTSVNDDNPYSQDILKSYWEQWLMEMGVTKFKVVGADIPSNMEKIISDFLSN